MTKTTFHVTKSALQFENLLLRYSGTPRAEFHRNMIDYFFQNNIQVHPHLLIRKIYDPNYIKKTEMEQIYLDDFRREQLEKAAKENGCGIGVILFQAMISYSVAVAPEILGKSDFERMFGLDEEQN